MREQPPHDQTPMVIAYRWAARITTVAIEMVAPGLVGVWIDGYLGTKVVFALLGFASGSVLAIWHLIQMTKTERNEKATTSPDQQSPKSRRPDR